MAKSRCVIIETTGKIAKCPICEWEWIPRPRPKDKEWEERYFPRCPNRKAHAGRPFGKPKMDGTPPTQYKYPEREVNPLCEIHHIPMAKSVGWYGEKLECKDCLCEGIQPNGSTKREVKII